MMTACVMTVCVGPGMLLNLHTSLRSGFLAGLAFVAGLYASDCTIIVIDYCGLSQILQLFRHQRLFGLVCGLVLCVFSTAQLLARPTDSLSTSRPDPRERPYRPGLPGAFLSGFAVNIANPFVFIFWITLLSAAVMNFGYRTRSFYEFIFSVVGTAFAFDVMKSFLFSKVAVSPGSPAMTWISRGTGAALAVVGIVLVCKSILQDGGW